MSIIQTSKPGYTSILDVGRNCWRIEHAGRVSYLVDGEAYFRAFREVAKQAQHAIIILGWDFDSRVKMLPDGESDGLPACIGEFFHALLARQRGLHIYVLTWDYHMVYALEREWWPVSRLGTHRRLHFKMDDAHPAGASHHQKVVVVDDTVAFSGGLDFAQCRWDTPEHRPDHPQRVFLDGRPCRPFHDVQMMVSGDAAAALGELVRERWTRAMGRGAVPRCSPRGGYWPSYLKPDLENVRVAIARTEPQYNHHPEIREVEHLYLDMIKAAQRFIYIETQYLTSNVVGAALEERLQQPDGPEIIIVLHPSSDGWLEQHTMDVLRGRLLKRLRAADRSQRLALYCPHVPGLGDQCLSMHSKVCIIDEELARVGSANMSNRSMGFDTECDLAVEAEGDPRIQQGIAQFRNRLLAEHLGVTPATIAEGLRQEGSAVAAIEKRRGGERTLKILDGQILADVDPWVPDAEFIDPDRPLELDTVVERVIPKEHHPPARRRLIVGVSILLALCAVAAAWHWTPLGEWLDVRTLAHYVAGFKDTPAAPFLVIGGFLVGGLIAIPVTLLIAITMLALGPLMGFIYSLAGVILSTLVSFGIGHRLGRQTVRRLAGPRLERLSQRLTRQGLLMAIAVHIIPVAPFTVINLIAGVSPIRLRDFLLGTVVGMLPGLLGIAIFMDQVSATIRDPTPASLLILAAVVLAILLGALGLRRWLSKRFPVRAPLSN